MYKRLFFLILILSGCSKKSVPDSIETVEVKSIAREVQIPKAVMTDLADEITNESKTVAPVYIFMPLQVQFTEFNEGVLKSPTLRFVLPKGGGEIDLKDVVTGFGSFYLNFPAEQFEDDREFMHLYFISNSPAKKIENETFGLGCGKMIDLKKSFGKLQKPDFLKLNTSEQRYLYVTAGLYVFIFRKAAQIYMAQLTITDSRYKKQFCLGTNL